MEFRWGTVILLQKEQLGIADLGGRLSRLGDWLIVTIHGRRPPTWPYLVTSAGVGGVDDPVH
jgi:hypothetical protein